VRKKNRRFAAIISADKEQWQFFAEGTTSKMPVIEDQFDGSRGKQGPNPSICMMCWGTFGMAADSDGTNSQFIGRLSTFDSDHPVLEQRPAASGRFRPDLGFRVILIPASADGFAAR